VHVPAAELRRHRAEMLFERGATLMEDEGDPADEQDSRSDSDPHGPEIGSRARLLNLSPGKGRHEVAVIRGGRTIDEGEHAWQS
jgi:hypothetical protein